MPPGKHEKRHFQSWRGKVSWNERVGTCVASHQSAPPPFSRKPSRELGLDGGCVIILHRLLCVRQIGCTKQLGEGGPGRCFTFSQSSWTYPKPDNDDEHLKEHAKHVVSCEHHRHDSNKSRPSSDDHRRPYLSESFRYSNVLRSAWVLRRNKNTRKNTVALMEPAGSRKGR